MWRTCTVCTAQEEIDEAVANRKAHWDNLEDNKAREQWGGDPASRAEHVGRVHAGVLAWEC